MKRLILAAALLAALAFPAPATAAVNEYSGLSCTQIWNSFNNPTPFACLTESTLFGGDKLILTGSSDIANLGNQAHTPGGLCSPKVAPPDTWNDCISAVWAQLGPSDSLCLEGDANYGALQWWASSEPTYRLRYSSDLGSSNDRVSSIRLQQSGTSCEYL